MDIYRTVLDATERRGHRYSIGQSECGLDIPCVHIGSTIGKQLIVTAGIHARECYTALVVIEQIRSFKPRRGGAYFIPLVDPDGALFFERGETFGTAYLKNNLDKRKEWKANAKGVDLNTNFLARFGTGKTNKRVRGASDFIGYAPLCAKESRALAAFTKEVEPCATVSYHALGGELYWEFFQDEDRRARDLELATAVSEHIGVKRVDGDLGSAGGYKDWCIQTLSIPAFTVELFGNGEHPINMTDFESDIATNADLPEFLLGL